MLKDEIPQEETPLVVDTPIGKKMIPISGIELARDIWGKGSDRKVEKNITDDIIYPDEVRIIDVSDKDVTLSMKETSQVVIIPLEYLPDYEG